MKSIIKSFFKDESGATAIEYGLIAAGIAIAIITAVNGLGNKLARTSIPSASWLSNQPISGHFGTGRRQAPGLFRLGQVFCVNNPNLLSTSSAAAVAGAVLCAVIPLFPQVAARVSTFNSTGFSRHYPRLCTFSSPPRSRRMRRTLV
jgi:pilus assembly protein Flp/PilA